jgi:hypothetical protein
MITVVTPDVNGLINPYNDEANDAVFPASAYVEDPNAITSLRTIENIWRDPELNLSLANQISELSFTISEKIVQEIIGEGHTTVAPLLLDYSVRMVSMACERLLRWKKLDNQIEGIQFAPREMIWEIPTIFTGTNFRSLQKTQNYHWHHLRLAIGAPDHIAWKEFGLRKRLHHYLSVKRSIAKQSDLANGMIYYDQLGRSSDVVMSLDLPFSPIPNLVQRIALKRNQTIRRLIKKIFYSELDTLWTKFDGPRSGLNSLAQLFADALPESRLEQLLPNLNRYDAFVEKTNARGVITAIGHAYHDHVLYFIVACNRKSRPSIILQHGGQYGYDNKMPHFFANEVCIVSHYISWGWKQYPDGYNQDRISAKIIPLPEPRLSEIVERGRLEYKPSKEAILLIPLSKMRTLDHRFGGIATDGHIADLRQFTAEVIKLVQSKFDRVIVTYRDGIFEQDPLYEMLQSWQPDRVQVMSSKEAPASTLFPSATAVLWDVTATGPFESILYGLPTVVLMREGRWAKNAGWAENLMFKSGIGVLTPEKAAQSLIQFSKDRTAWNVARENIQLVLESYALTSPNYREQWETTITNILGKDKT